jgi:hypothetical protein
MDYTKNQKRVLKRLIAEAHKRELTQALKRLYVEFRHWESGDIDAFELDEKIHNYHQNDARIIWSRYDGRLPLLMVLAGTVQLGLMTLEELPSEFREKVGQTLQGLSAQ